jgi:hypothetical protein
MRCFKPVILGFFLLMLCLSPARGTDSSLQLNLDVKEFRLNNGMLFLVVERNPGKPVLPICLNI